MSDLIIIQVNNLDAAQAKPDNYPIEQEIESWLSDLGYDIAGIAVLDGSKVRFPTQVFKQMLADCKDGAS